MLSSGSHLECEYSGGGVLGRSHLSMLAAMAKFETIPFHPLFVLL